MHHALPGAQTAQDGTNIPLMKDKPTCPAVLSRGEWVTWTTKQPETGEYPKATQQSYCSSPPGREDSSVYSGHAKPKAVPVDYR